MSFSPDTLNYDWRLFADDHETLQALRDLGGIDMKNLHKLI